MKFDLKFISDQLTSVSLEELKKLATDLKKLANATEKELQYRNSTNLVEYVPDCLDLADKDLVLGECESMNFGNCDRKVGTQWLSSTKEPAIYFHRLESSARGCGYKEIPSYLQCNGDI